MSVRQVTVTFLPNQVQVPCRTDQTLMEAVKEQGIRMKIACKNGICLICGGDYRNGEFQFSNPQGQTVLEQNNRVLCCLAKPQTDAEIYMPSVQHPDYKEQQTLTFQVQGVTALNDEVYRVELLAPAGKTADFWPGQYLMLHLLQENGEPKQVPYSIASAPGSMTSANSRALELHIAATGDTANAVIAQLQKDPLVKVTLPAGDCFISPTFLRQHPQQPLVLIASGTGFAQIKSLAEAVLALEPQREIHLYWSNRSSDGFYLKDLPLQWAHQYSNLHYHPILEQHSEGWHGRAGWIYQVIQHDFDDLTNVQVFACGSPNMVYGTLDQLQSLGLSQANMHSDVFAYAPRN
ncbi:2Fe-2S iron-sulfur cluster-binding protein [Parathalassolituus penaei]|uniref:2Fe-2S iron-sulfur cluster-binding protein n=1 Tax=Parathalassolituus penaei TaxID=2997323 RepID=A0A9X3IST5_9GAMM|nr:2Fe-2S iron-sulfur cluster-binding protein [Parathalassolituus penaei]MCY0965214.1 2Fe-2S iron-sulfur cluster-binding protein [Parathalassolituus penaei]